MTAQLSPGVSRSREAERHVVAGILRWPAVVADVAAVLTAEDFTAFDCREIFRAALSLWEAGRPIDLAAVADVLFKAGTLDDCGGYAALGELWDSEPTGANAAYHAGRVREMSVVRRLNQAGNEIASLTDPDRPAGSADELTERAEQLVFGVSGLGAAGQSYPMSEFAPEGMERIEARHRERRNLSGMSTGLIDLDDITSGLQAGELVIVAARPSCGKTSFGLHLAAAALEGGEGVFFASLEQGRLELFERLLCRDARVDSHDVRRAFCDAARLARLRESTERLRSLPFFVDDTAGQTAGRVAASARRHRLRHGVALVVVDYLQLLAPADPKAQRYEQVGQSARRLKTLAREIGVPVVAMAQLSRAAEARGGQPKLSDLRESGDIENHADVVMMLHRPEGEPGQQGDVIEVLIKKQRNGPTGDVNLVYRKEWFRFENYAADPFPE